MIRYNITGCSEGIKFKELDTGDWMWAEDVFALYEDERTCEKQLIEANERIAELEVEHSDYDNIIRTWEHNCIQLERRIKVLDEELSDQTMVADANTDVARACKDHIETLAEEISELRSRHLGIDKTYELVQAMRKETAMEIYNTIDRNCYWLDALGKINLLNDIEKRYEL